MAIKLEILPTIFRVALLQNVVFKNLDRELNKCTTHIGKKESLFLHQFTYQCLSKIIFEFFMCLLYSESLWQVQASIEILICWMQKKNKNLTWKYTWYLQFVLKGTASLWLEICLLILFLSQEPFENKKSIKLKCVTK